VVVSEEVFNNSRIDSVVVCGLTTNLKRANEPGNVLLELGEGGLAKQSVLVVSLVSSVQKSALAEPTGRLSEERVDQALAGLRFQQASARRPY
jgi:mRNA interferase MazF